MLYDALPVGTVPVIPVLSTASTPVTTIAAPVPIPTNPALLGSAKFSTLLIR